MKLSEHFEISEFACHCGRRECDAPPMRAEFLFLLEQLRQRVGFPLVPTSGTRCEYWNRKVGGAPRSEHTKGNAVDLAATPGKRELIAKAADELGFGGIGVGATFVHVDGRKRKTGEPPMTWTYGPRTVA